MWKGVLAAVATVAGAEAGAATLVVQFTGTVFDSLDPGGYFNGSPQDPRANDGLEFTLAYNLDTAVLTRDGEPGVFDEFTGQSDYVTTLTIGGVTQTSYLGYAEDFLFVRTQGTSYSVESLRFQNESDEDGERAYEFTTRAIVADPRLELPIDILAPFSLDLTGLGFDETGNFAVVDEECPPFEPGCKGFATGRLQIAGLSVTVDGRTGPDLTPPAPVPVPASVWLLLGATGGLAWVGRGTGRQ